MSGKRVGKYEIGRTLGEGTFGKVKHAVNVESGLGVAIKVLDKERIQKQSMGHQIKKEISIMKQLEHPNIVKLSEVLASKTKIFIVLELVTGGELFDLIVKSGRLEEKSARWYLRQLVDGVGYCHSQGVAHRDLKPENLLLDENLNLKISDFGLSALYEGEEGATRSQMLHTTCGTPNYVAPEVLQNEGYDGRIADVWSIGVVLYVLLAGFLPFDETTMSALFAKIKNADYAYPDFFSHPVTHLIDQILVADPSTRITLDDIKRDPWFACDEESATPEKITAENAPAPAFTSTTTTSNEIPNKLASTRVVDYYSSLAQNQLASHLKTTLTQLGCETADGGDRCDADGSTAIEASIVTASGLVTATALLSPSGLNTNIRLLRGKGDILAYNAFHARLIDALQPLLV